MSKKQENTADNQAALSEKKKNPGLRLIIFLIEAVILAAGIAGSVALINSYNDPERVAKSYFEALKEGDYATAYSYLRTEEGEETSDFLNVNVYASVMEQYGFAEENANVTHRKEEQFGETNYLLDAGRGTHTIQVAETGKKRWFLFREYEVCPQEFYVDEVYITAPKMMTISVNGIELNGGNSTRDDSSSDVYLSSYETAYKIDRMIVGDYRIQASGDIFQTYTEDVTLNAYYNIIMLDEPVIKDGMIDQIVETVPEMIKSLYQSALNGDDAQTAFAAAGLHAPSEDEQIQYEDLVDDFTIDDGYFTRITMSDFEPTSYGGYFDWETGDYRTDVILEYTLTYDYDILDWWSGSYYESKEDDSYGYFDCDLIYRDGEWVIENLYIYSNVYAW